VTIEVVLSDMPPPPLQTQQQKTQRKENHDTIAKNAHSHRMHDEFMTTSHHNDETTPVFVKTSHHQA